MHIDLDKPGLNSSFRSDLCVVGGGIAGILLASRLGQCGRTVHLLEAGGLGLEERSQALYRTEMAGERHSGAANGRFRTFGGSSTRWGGQLLPYTEDVLHPDSRLGLPSWPIELAELERYYGQVQDAMGVPNSPFSQEMLSDFDCGLPFTSSSVRLRFSKCAPFAKRNLAKTLGRRCIESMSITVFTHANVLSVDLNRTGNAATGVTVASYTGQTYKFLADQVAICTGTIEASRLLLSSTEVCPYGVGNDHDQVGRYFHDHLELRVAVVAGRDRNRIIGAFGPFVKGGTTFRAKLEATAELRARRSLLSVAGQFSIEEPPGSGADLVRKTLRGFQQGRLQRGFLRDVLRLPNSAAETVRIILEAKVRNRRYVSSRGNVVLDVGVEQRPDSESRIRLAQDRDALGMRKAILDWRVSDDERESLRCYTQELESLLREHALATVPWPAHTPLKDEPWYGSNQRDTFHMMGGTRMGGDPASSVVDSSLKVHGVRNLYIASCGVFPTGGSSNPTFTMMALALRLADHLRCKTFGARQTA